MASVSVPERAVFRLASLLDLALVSSVELVAHFERVFGLVDHLVARVADIDLFLALLILSGELLGFL